MIRRRSATAATTVRRRSGRAIVAAFLLIVTACGDGSPPVRAVVLEVDGDLTAVRSFVVALPDGSRLTLVPDDGLRFEDGSPLSHLQEHVVSGQRVEVRYTRLDDGTLVALEVADAP